MSSSIRCSRRGQRDNPPPMLELEKPSYQKRMNKAARDILGVAVKPEPPQKAAERLAAKYSQPELLELIQYLPSLIEQRHEDANTP